MRYYDLRSPEAGEEHASQSHSIGYQGTIAITAARAKQIITGTFDKDTMKANQLLSKQVVWKYGSVDNLTLFSHFGSSAQRLANGNTLICATTEGYMVEVDTSGNVVREYINPVTNSGIVTAIGDNLPMTNAVPRAARYAANFAGFTGHTLTPGTTITGNVFPTIANTTHTPSAPSASDSVWVTSQITDDGSIASATLTYSTGSGTPATTTPFTETMTATATKPWTGTGAVNAWTVTGNYFETRTQANYGTGNACGVEYKGLVANNDLSSAMLATTNGIAATGTSGYVEFYVQTQTLDGTDGWTFQLDAGSGLVTRLSELTGSSHGWQQYHYDLAAGELVNTLKMRFQFTGGGASDDDRIDLDQIALTVTSGPAAVDVTMYDDGAHGDGTAGDHVYGGLIPAQAGGTTVTYYVTATDNAGLVTTDPATVPTDKYSYTVGEAALTVNLAAASVSESESAGSTATTVTIARNTDTASALIVNLASSDTSEATVPATATIPAGQSSVTINLAAVDDAVVDGMQTVTITASASGFASGSDNLQVNDDDTNRAPVLGGVPTSVTIPELAPYIFTATATDPDIPSQTLTFSLAAYDSAYLVPAGAAIDPNTGVFSWTPTESQGPGVYLFKVQVSDGSFLTVQTVALAVAEVNLAPMLASIGDKTVDELAPLNFTVSATDQDYPAQTLFYSLDSASIGLGMSIDPTTGAFSWTPKHDYMGQHEVTVTATDNGFSPANLTASQTFSITVNGVANLAAQASDYSLLLRLNPTNPSYLELINARNSKIQYWTAPANNVFGLTINGLENKADILTVDYATGYPANLREVVFNAKGGTKVTDSLVIKNSAKNPPAIYDRAEINADRVVFNNTTFKTQDVVNVSLDTGTGNDTIVISALGANVTLVDPSGTVLDDTATDQLFGGVGDDTDRSSQERPAREGSGEPPAANGGQRPAR